MTISASRTFFDASYASNIELFMEPGELQMFFKFYYSHNAVSSYGTSDIGNMYIENDAYDIYLDDKAQQAFEEAQAIAKALREAELEKIRSQAIEDFRALGQEYINPITQGDDVCNQLIIGLSGQ